MKRLGPGVLIAAAFIGPGTITACTLAGVSFGYALLWAMLFSVLATMLLQEMAARLGLVTQHGLAAAIRDQLRIKWIRNGVVVIILLAILVGNAAYEAGNIGGAVLGMQALFDTNGGICFPLLIGSMAFVLLWAGNYKVLEKVFIGLIGVMSLSFLITAILTKPDLLGLIKGLLLPSFPQESTLTIIALIGTTIVPYNLFLHASLVNQKWKSKSELNTAKWDTIFSIGLGGVVSMAIIVAASAVPIKEVTGATDLAKGLEPLFGPWARYFMGSGLFAAGVTSSITAPLAAAFVANSCFGWKAGLKDLRFRLVWILVLAVGVLTLTFGFDIIQVIKFAQIANGILLPLIAVLLVAMASKSEVMGKHKNARLQNVLGVVVILVCLVLGIKSIIKVLGLL